MKTAAVRLLCFCVAVSALGGCRALRDTPIVQDAATASGTGGGGGDAAADMSAAGQDRPTAMGDGPTAADVSAAGQDRPTAMGDGSTVVVNGKQANGKACGAGGDCESGFCTDGVCCNEACGGMCKACASTYTGGADGVCANVMAGASSRGACPDETMTKPCGQDGTCNGAGQCKTVAAGQSCGDATCTDAKTFQPAATCDGAGACVVGATTDCGAYPCATTGCAKPCTAATDCAAAQYCVNGTCKVKKSSGTSCTAASECGSGFCSPDQVCCDKACTGACTACLKAMTGQSDGTCAPVQVGQDPRNDCEMAVATSCGKDGTCDGKGGCHLYASGMACAAGSCSGSMFTPGKTCNGSGMCSGSGSATDCGQNACTVEGCKTACKLDGDCGATGYCDKAAMKCAAKKNNGSPCGGGGECSSGACVEGICCNTACTGSCLSCSGAKTGGANGTCAFIKGGMPDARCTAADKATCGQNGNCDGAGKCEKWPSSTVCAAGSCSSGNYLATRMCNGQGVCNPAAQTTCGGAVCDAATGCRTTCTNAADCSGNNYCDPSTKKCTPLKPNGGACGTDGKQCMSGFCVDGVCCNTGQCGGQCQSCSTGTCKSVTTPRMPCPGNGTCVGTCNGTNPACTFPGTSVPCASAGCANASTKTFAATCNGSGSCSTQATEMCSGGATCSAGACGCPSGQTNCPVGGCINTKGSDAKNCGSCGNSCSSAMPACVNGACKQCSSTVPCKTGESCNNNMCVCNPSNVLQNSNFDSSLSSWVANMATWDRNEGAAALKRGAEITQCIHLAYPGAMYTLQFSYKMIEAGIFACQAIFSNDANCTSRIDGDLDGTIVYSGGDGWQTSKILGPAPGGAKSVNMYCVNGNSSDTAILYFDKITLTPSSCN